jgi:hypothetical protein
MTFLLKFTPEKSESYGKYAETEMAYYLKMLGSQWPHAPQFRFIEATTPDIEQAKEFATEEDARACWSEANKPKGWDIIAK